MNNTKIEWTETTWNPIKEIPFFFKNEGLNTFKYDQLNKRISSRNIEILNNHLEHTELSDAIFAYTEDENGDLVFWMKDDRLIWVRTH